MQLWILRHGEAVWPAPSDPERALTARGEAENKALAETLNKQSDRCDYLLHSPYLRARQTATQLLSALDLPSDYDIHTEAGLQQALSERNHCYQSSLLCPDVAVSDCLEMLEQFIAKHQPEGLLVVGHNPLFTAMANFLIYGNESQALSLGTSGLCQLEFDVLAGGCADLIGVRQAPEFQLLK